MSTASRGLDAYYTPSWLAKLVAEALPSDLRGAVLDPCVGTGALLEAVGERFGSTTQLLGMDIDGPTVSAISAVHPDWSVSRADFLVPRSRRASTVWRAASRELSAVVLNPPFSYRGNGGRSLRYLDFEGRVAPAMHFLVEILTELSPTRGVIAVLPDGALDAERHESLWSQIGTRFNVERLERIKTSSFRGARVSTSLIRLELGASVVGVVAPIEQRKLTVAGCRCVELVRGRVPVHVARGFAPDESTQFLHTTSARGGTLMTAPSSLSDEAPLVVLNRIGKWRAPFTIEVGRVVLSDCLIALRPRERHQLDSLVESITRAQKDFAGEYRGTGAQYVTVAAVIRQLHRLGWHPHQVMAGSPIAECCCSANELAECAP